MAHLREMRFHHRCHHEYERLPAHSLPGLPKENQTEGHYETQNHNNTMKEAMIYRLRIKRRSLAATYPTFHICDAELFYYPTKETAEEKIRGFEWAPDLYCFVLEACPFDRDVADKSYRRWVYDDGGDFISETLCSEFEDPKTREQEEYFPGRRQDQCRFKPGDYVEVVFNDTVTLGIVKECPPTPEDVADQGSRWSRYDKPFEGKAEFEEDAYTILKGGIDLHKYSQYDEAREFSYTTNVMPASLPIPPETRQQLKRLLIAVHDEIEYAKFDECRLGPLDTGLEKDLIVRSKMSTSEPVIYYLTPGNGALTVSVEKEPRRIRGYMESVTAEEFAQVKEWIKLNCEVLMSNWNEPDSGALCENVKAV